METNFGIVIDKNYIKVAFVVLDGVNSPMFYELKEGEKVILKDWNIANTMLKPKWNDVMWAETATDEELKEWKEQIKPIESSEENLIDKLILDNINMQMQIDSLIESQLGGN